MMQQSGRAQWTVRHLLYPSSAARLALLTGPVQALSQQCAVWFFVDIPFYICGGVRQGIELAVRHAPGDDATMAAIEQALHTATADGIVVSANPPATPVVLQPALFPAGLVSVAYSAALTVGSVRALTLFTTFDESAGATDLLVQAELAAGYHALFPRPAARRTAVLYHAAWLEAIAGPGSEVPVAAIAGPPTAAAPITALVEFPVSLRRALQRHARHAAARLADPREDGMGKTVLAMLVGRLLHTHAVRLWGPDGNQHALRTEIALLRGLCAQCMTASVHQV